MSTPTTPAELAALAHDELAKAYVCDAEYAPYHVGRAQVYAILSHAAAVREAAVDVTSALAVAFVGRTS